MGLIWLLCAVISTLFVLADATDKRGKNIGCLWTLIVFFTFPIGLIAYLIVRNSEVIQHSYSLNSIQYTFRTIYWGKHFDERLSIKSRIKDRYTPVSGGNFCGNQFFNLFLAKYSPKVAIRTRTNNPTTKSKSEISSLFPAYFPSRIAFLYLPSLS